ncbi:hypothetical protein J2Z40_002811 [Cytobacillus eiseniae]|uniref:Atrophied bacterial Ig domain-containing protein n=1 Tax=Cytobacillus eiseniae TaxID=762947 RepID=A0ABS4RKC3_9BACI|nr:immunoglobulin-like domain-containing protein [Cytobacillus eiseniae]MBP2242237.1 hypothetical protein [Cytobacillus eiseniae]
MKKNKILVCLIIFMMMFSYLPQLTVDAERLSEDDSTTTEGTETILEESDELTDEQIVEAVKSTLAIVFAEGESESNVTQSLTLPASGIEETTITWSIDLEDIIDAEGTVKRPTDEDKLVTLTATITKNEVTDTKTFHVTVIRQLESAAPVLTAGEVERVSNSEAAVRFTSSKAGQYYFELVPSGETAPIIETVDAGTAVTTEEATIRLIDLSAGGKDIYIQVKDEEGNVSEALAIEIPAYEPSLPIVGRHVTVGEDVFLGGKYIEVGISKSGSFGTNLDAPHGFHPINRSNLGFVYDADGFDMGKEMNSGDYFLPGSPYEGFLVGYKNGEMPTTFLNAERNEVITIPSISIEDLSSGDTLAAKTSGKTNDNKLKVEQLVSFKVDNKFFKMTVEITNTTDETLHDVRYMRSVDPDIDLDMKGTYNTINSVPFNFPNDNKSVALAVGPETGNALLLMSTDSRSRASLVTSDMYSLAAYNDDGVIAESNSDTWMGLTFALGNLAPGQTEIVEYFYSLDSNIDQTIEDIEEAAPGMSDDEAVANAKASLEIGYEDGDNQSSVTKNLTLPTSGENGTIVSWSSNTPGVISPEGTINRPSYINGNAFVTLTATIKKGDSIETKTFIITVVKLPITDREAISIAGSALNISYAAGDSATNVTQNLTLPLTGEKGTIISWSTSHPDIIAENGNVSRPTRDTEVILTATIKKNGITETIIFRVKVLKERTSSYPEDDYENTASEPTTEEIVDVDGANGENLTKTPITRTTGTDGKVKDHVSMSETVAKDTVEKAKQQGVNTARIVIPDTNDKVSEITVEIPKSAMKQLNDGKMKLEIATDNAIIAIPTASISSFDDDLYFRVVPLKTKEQQKQVEDRAKKEEIVKEIAQNQTVQVLGRPMEIETNMQNREVSIVLPLKDSLPADAKEREKILDNLAIFIEHSDGTKEVLQGKVVTYKNNGELGLEFTVNKFSTFTIVYMEGADTYFAGKETCGKDVLPADAIGCVSAKKTVPVYELVNNRLKKVDVLKGSQSAPAYESISPMLGLGGDIWVERTNAIRYETPSKAMLAKNALTGSKRVKQMWKGLELRPGQIGKVTILQDTVIWEKINKTNKLPRILKKGEQYRVYRYVPGMYDLGNGIYVVQDGNITIQ